MRWSVEQFVNDYIPRWEGGLSLDPNDAGNWSGGKKGVGTLIGSNHGVTYAVLTAWNGSPATADQMKNLSLQAACAIAGQLFYYRVNLDYLPWNHVTASVMDFGWTAGPANSIKLLQKMLGVDQDGAISQNGQTAKAMATMVNGHEAATAGRWCQMREEYYEALTERLPSDKIYLKGWDNRSEYFLPGNASGWWNRFGA